MHNRHNPWATGPLSPQQDQPWAGVEVVQSIKFMRQIMQRRGWGWRRKGVSRAAMVDISVAIGEQAFKTLWLMAVML